MSKKELPDAVLTPEELAAIEAEIQRDIDRELRAKAKENIKRDLERKARIQRGLEEPFEQLEINLPEHADRIVINSVPFMHGRTYEVRTSTANQLRETMHRAWQHQAVVEGRQKDFYTRRNTRMSGLTGATTNAPLLRA